MNLNGIPSGAKVDPGLPSTGASWLGIKSRLEMSLTAAPQMQQRDWTHWKGDAKSPDTNETPRVLLSRRGTSGLVVHSARISWTDQNGYICEVPNHLLVEDRLLSGKWEVYERCEARPESTGIGDVRKGQSSKRQSTIRRSIPMDMARRMDRWCLAAEFAVG